MKRLLLLLVILVTAGLPAWSERDFLTTDEVAQIRETQEPNARLKLYARFAKQRVDLLGYLLRHHKPGRASFIHQALEDYTKIIDAMDTVADDALERGIQVNEGIAAVAKAEKQFVEVLKKILAARPRDLEYYRFVLENAIDATTDSLQASTEDLGRRKAEVVQRERRRRREVEALMAPENARERRAQDAKRKKEEKERKRKAPTLFRKGEKKPPGV